MLSTSLDLNIVVSLMMAASAVNSAIKINYAGSGNNSQFVYDGSTRLVSIVENSGGSITSDRQFVWCDNKICEARNASSFVLSQYFSYGQTVNGGNYFYTKDHLDSIRELLNSSGNLQTEYMYDPFGKVTIAGGAVVSDFQYGGYYFHTQSGLNLTRYREYQPTFGRFLRRDPIEETGGINLFGYVENNPISDNDPSGLIMAGGAPPPPPPGRNNPNDPNDPNDPRNPNSVRNLAQKICDGILIDLEAAIKELQKRKADRKKPNNKLPEKKCDSRGRKGTEPGHQQQYKNRQRNLNTIIKAWNDAGCGPLPEGAEDLSNSPLDDLY